MNILEERNNGHRVGRKADIGVEWSRGQPVVTYIAGRQSAVRYQPATLATTDSS